ncbi:MAG: hypothetical protein CL609_01885 [Anaerolineaceae bacterium]|nr:hypothetical protein [Anaerolineaceae bacterium]
MAKSGRKSGRVFIIVALVLIIVVLGATYAFIRLRPILMPAAQPTVDQPAQIQVEEMVDIVLTTQFIARGEVITEGVVAMIPFPKKELIDGTFITDMEEVVGKKALYPLEPRMPITPSMILDAVTGGSIAAFDLPVDKTALSVPIDREALIAYAPQAGDHVMVIGCMWLVDIDPEFQTILPNLTGQVTAPSPATETSPETLSASVAGGGSAVGRTELDATLNEPFYLIPSEEQRPRLVCQNLIQDAIVLRVGEFSLDGVDEEPVVEQQPAPGTEEAAPVEEIKPDIVTLVVSPQDAVLLNYIKRAGIEFSLALRNPNNTQEIVTDAVTQQYLMDQKNIPLPAKLPFAVEPNFGELATAPETTAP